MAREWWEVGADLIGQGINYLAARENSKAAKDSAKVRARVAGPITAQRRLVQSGLTAQQIRKAQKKSLQAQQILGQGMMQPSNGGVITLPQYVPTQRAPYIQQAAYDPEGLPEPFESAVEAYQMGRQFLFPQTERVGGTVLADSWGEMFTPTGNLRGTVAIMQPNGSMTFARNVGQPVLFSRDATICKRVRSRSAKVAHAAGHRHRVTRRKR